jgi:hypothetical protein
MPKGRIARGVTGVALAVLSATSGCVPTISLHKYRDVVVTMTDAQSGAPVANMPFRVVYTYSPIDDPLVAHVELRTPREVRAETDAQGKTVVMLADYAWDILVYVKHYDEEGFAGFILPKDAIRSGGVVESYTNPRLRLELLPIAGTEHPMQGASE